MNFRQLLLTLVFSFSATMAFANVDLKKSSFEWKASKKLGKTHYGNIFLKSGKATVKGDKIVSGEFVMDMKSFTVTDLKGEWADKFLGHVKSGDFFEVEKHPTANLVITEQVDKDTVKGKLTIKGKTEPVTVDFKKNGKAYTGTFKFDRTKFDVKYGSANFFKLAADKVINDEVLVEFKVVVN